MSTFWTQTNGRPCGQGNVDCFTSIYASYVIILFLSYVTSATAMSSLIASIDPYLIIGLPRFLFRGSSIISIIIPIYPLPFLGTCPDHPRLASRVISTNRHKRLPSLLCILNSPLLIEYLIATQMTTDATELLISDNGLIVHCHRRFGFDCHLR